MRKALCIGINDYPISQKLNRGIDLKGCVNDANAWGNLLADHFDFPRSDIQLILDKDATKEKMADGLKNLLKGAQPGDNLVYAFSGHGTYLASKSQTQMDYDQAQCPHDWESNLLVDNELREMFYNLPKGIKLTVISDSCHSGSVTRLGKEALKNERMFESDSRLNEDDFLSPLSGVQLPRHLPPNWFGGEELDEIEFEGIGQKLGMLGVEHPEHEMNDVLLSGCNQFEFSWDSQFPSGHHGALTFYAIHAIKRANYQVSFRAMHKQVRKWLNRYKFKQTPQLEGRSENKERPVFR